MTTPVISVVSAVARQRFQALKEWNIQVGQRLLSLETNRSATGARGDVGPQGEVGPPGSDGFMGAVGADGAQGETGPAGPQGTPGSQGVQGVQGVKGDTGDTGPQGPAGPPGNTGPQGLQGNIGPQGLAGAQGIQGLAGLIGLTGPAGPAGSDSWTWTKLLLDSVNATVTLANVTGLSFTGTALTTYLVEAAMPAQTAATTTGIALALDVPAGATVWGLGIHAVSATAVGSAEQISDAATTGATTGVRAANTATLYVGKWLAVIGATGGTVQLQMRSEIAASAATLKAGGIFGWRAI
ncbi:MAG: hypothetical protein V4696_07485 [Pseudomonadota bacterium]